MTREELMHALKAADCIKTLDSNRFELEKIMPEIAVMFDYDQKNQAHQYDLWVHSLQTVAGLPRNLDDEMVYLAALLHDIGKPISRCAGTKPDDTNMHYYGHPQKSMEIVQEKIIPDLTHNGIVLSEEEQKHLLYYVEYHDDRVSLKLKHIKRHMKMVSFMEFQNLMLLQVADAKAHVQLPIIVERVEICSALASAVGEQLYKLHLNEKKRKERKSKKLQ